jgi:ribosomal protein S17E
VVFTVYWRICLSRSYLLIALASIAIALAGCGSSSSPKPAAVVNSHTISMAQYTQEYRYECANAISSYGFDVCHDKGPSAFKANLKKTVMHTLIDNEIINQYAAKHQVTVSDAAFQRNWSAIYKARFGSQKILKTFVAGYHMSVAQFQARIRRDMLREAVAGYVTRNAPTKVPAVSLARLQVANSAANLQVTSALKHKVTFLSLVKQYDTGKTSACSSKTACGYLGWVPTAFLPSYDQKLGSASPGVAVGPQSIQGGGYEWFLVVAKNRSYSLTNNQIVTMRNQVLFPRWLAAQEKQATVKRFVTA